MAATDGQIVVAAARWAEEGQYLREFVAKHKLPTAVKIVKGQYAGMGVPTLPSPGLQSMALLVSAGRRHKIVAQAIKIKEGRKMVGVGPRFAIPDTYTGYFELLSEEGRAMRCMESVAELARRRPENGCLVRDSVRGIVGKYDIDGNLSADGARIVNAGETLLAETEVQLANCKTKLLRCVDSVGHIILLPMEQKGKFSALAKQDNISGVHTAKNLLTKRLPITVRLVHGSPPRGLKNLNQFVPELRLLSTYEEEHVFAMPLQKETNTVIALPLATPLKLQKARNEEHLKDLREYQRLVDKCTRLVADVADRAHVFDGKLGDSKALRMPGGASAGAGSGGNILTSKNGYFLRRSVSSDSANQPTHIGGGGAGYTSENRLQALLGEEYDEIDQIYDYVRGFAPLPKHIRSPFPDSSDNSPNSHNNTNNNNNSNNPYNCNNHNYTTATNHNSNSNNDNNNNNNNNNNSNNNSSSANTNIVVGGAKDVVLACTTVDNIIIKPEPPPIETIPTKKLTNVLVKAEKRTRRVANKNTDGEIALVSGAGDKHFCAKLYVKNSGNSQNRRLLRQKSSSPLKEHPPLVKTGSPIFNIRYKSLNNLQQAMELDGTLDSSHSGGRTSGDSGAGAKLPEKRSRRLSRPRSLTNLVWDIQQQKQPHTEVELVCERKFKPLKLEPGVHKRNSSHRISSSQKKIGTTLYL